MGCITISNTYQYVYLFQQFIKYPYDECMKKIFISEIINKIKAKPHIYKKLKIFAVIGIVGILSLGTITVYLGVLGARYVASLSTDIYTTENAEKLKSKIRDIPTLTKSNCIETAQNFLNLDTLFNKPMIENFQLLKKSCFEPTVTEPTKTKEADVI